MQSVQPSEPPSQPPPTTKVKQRRAGRMETQQRKNQRYLDFLEGQGKNAKSARPNLYHELRKQIQQQQQVTMFVDL